PVTSMRMCLPLPLDRCVGESDESPGQLAGVFVVEPAEDELQRDQLGNLADSPELVASLVTLPQFAHGGRVEETTVKRSSIEQDPGSPSSQFMPQVVFVVGVEPGSVGEDRFHPVHYPLRLPGRAVRQAQCLAAMRREVVL